MRIRELGSVVVAVLLVSIFVERQPVAGDELIPGQETKQMILSLISELYPEVTGTGDKRNVKKPGYEVEKRVHDELIAIANGSRDLRSLLVGTLVNVLEDPVFQDGAYYSSIWSCAASVFGELKAVEAIDVLSDHLDLQHGHASLSFNGFPAVPALIEIGEPAIQRLQGVLLSRNSNSASRVLAAFVLGEIGGQQAKAALERAYAVEQDPNVLRGIKLSLSLIERTQNR